MKITTKGGDNATTSLMFGRRVSKAHPRVRAYGAVDELSATTALARAFAAGTPLADELLQLQKRLVLLMTELATANEDYPKLAEKHVALLDDTHLAELEKRIAEFEEHSEKFTDWKYAGETPLDATLDLARTRCRAAEREIAALNELEPLPRPFVLKYINRLSDYFFATASTL